MGNMAYWIPNKLYNSTTESGAMAKLPKYPQA